MRISNQPGILPGSFRDSSGFLFTRDGTLYRQINTCFLEEYDTFIASGLYERLVSKKLLIPHKETDTEPEVPETAYIVIKPQKIPFISYPYEWCFSQLKDAAMITLQIEKLALEHGMTLKDASAYNIQFLDGKPVFIDTLSFERYVEGDPWLAYRQFCQHFLAPLLLMQQKDIRLNQLLRIYIDGVPLDLASTLLPKRSWLKKHSLLHIHLHARSQKKYADTSGSVKKPAQTKVSRIGRLGLLDSLINVVQDLSWLPENTEWRDYYTDNSYSTEGFTHKQEIVKACLDKIKPESVWDFGANTGEFSRLASVRGVLTISYDIDPACVELNYQDVIRREETHLLPLLLDFTNPSPGIGWENQERDSFADRGPADTILALALVHHLAISNNVPLDMIAGFFSRLSSSLIIEFVPKEDVQVQRLLSGRKDIFDHYSKEGFEEAFGRFFTIERTEAIRDSLRMMYCMRRKE
jgi:hypothetical protein